MKKWFFFLFACLCSSTAVAQTTWTPTLTDSLTIDGVCTLREAFRACALRAAVDTCAAGAAPPAVNTMNLPAGTFSATITGNDNTALAGDLDVGCHLIVQGAGRTSTIIDMNGIDRAFHASGNSIFEVRDLTIREGCANGGTCTSTIGGVIAAGGGYYHNSVGRHRQVNVTLDSNVANQGGGAAICATASTFDHEVDGASIVNNTALGAGGGGMDVHTHWTLRNSYFGNNTSSSASGVGAGLRIWDRVTTIVDTIFEDNVAAGAGGGIASVGLFSGTVSSTINMLGGEFRDNIAGANGGNVFVNAASAGGGTNLYSSPCSSAGCVVTLEDTLVSGGTADAPSSAPAGSGGNLYANPSSSTPGRINLEGMADVSSGVDSTTPAAPDCEGNVHLYDSSDVADTTGCTITDHRPTGPVCGNSVVETGEDCDSTACCDVISCLYEAATTSCSDDDTCTIGDACDGAGDCVSGEDTPCGDGTLQTACGETCDDSNTSSNDGCSSSCSAETCVAWE